MLSIRVSSSSRLVDIKALLATWAIRLELDGKTYLEAPLYTQFGPGPVVISPEVLQGFLPRAGRYSVTLFNGGPPALDRAGEMGSYRWPFYVAEILMVWIKLPVRTGGWNWEFIFEPGQTYDVELTQVDISETLPEAKP